VTARVSQAAIGEAIKEHADTMHTDLHEQIKAVQDTQEEIKVEIKKLAENSAGVITAYNGMGLLKRGIIDVGKITTALIAIGGAIISGLWVATHLGSLLHK